MLESFGLQLFSIRNTMNTAENIRESFRRIREMGYEHGQTAGCAIPYAEFGRIARRNNMSMLREARRADLRGRRILLAEDHEHLRRLSAPAAPAEAL